jgi:hypothetical protein
MIGILALLCHAWGHWHLLHGAPMLKASFLQGSKFSEGQREYFVLYYTNLLLLETGMNEEKLLIDT